MNGEWCVTLVWRDWIRNRHQRRAEAKRELLRVLAQMDSGIVFLVSE